METVFIGDDIAARYRHTTSYYDLVVLTSPTRIESLRVDPTGRGRFLGVVNNFGRLGSTVFASYGSFSEVEANAFVAGRPEAVVSTAGELRLERVPVGPHGLYVTWAFVFDETGFDIDTRWTVERRQANLWELGWKLDGVARRVEATHDGVPAVTWREDDPRYAHNLTVSLLPDTAGRLDRVAVEQPPDRPTSSGIWSTVYAAGGERLEPGALTGRWRITASPPADEHHEEEGHHRRVLEFADAIEPPNADLRRVRRGPGRSWLLADDRALVAFVPDGESWHCRLYAADGESWQYTAAAGPAMRFTTVDAGGDGSLVVHGELLDERGSPQVATTQIWELRDGAVRITAVDTPLAGHRVHPMHSFLAYPGRRTKHDLERYDVLAGPSLGPQADLITGQRALWSPALCVQHEGSYIALVPDLREHRRPDRHGAMPTSEYFGPALDLDVANVRVDAPVLSFGWRAVEGVYGYYFRDKGTTPAETVRLSYEILVAADARPRSVVSDVQQRLWRDVGHRYFQQSRLPQTQPAEAAFDEAWSYWHEHYYSTKLNGTTVGAVRTDRVHEPGINFMSWFNALRTSYGLFTYGRDRGDSDLMSKGRATLELMLAAPQESGAFPTIADVRDGGVEWQASHRNFLDQMPWGPSCYATFDMGWAAYWLLRWHQDLEPDSRAVAFARAYGDFVLGVQLPSGAVPSWVHVGTLEINPRLRESAQTAGSVLILAELAKVTGDETYLTGALRAAGYVTRNHLDTQRWDDFEPYYSNTLKSEGASDPFSGQHAQSTLAMHFAALGLLTLHELTGDPRWLDDGQRAIDTLLQYQYVTPGIGLSMNCFGGFAVQNTDNEALDARQSQFGVTLLDYARATGRSDYAERGIAALRGGFATMASPSAESINPRYFDAFPIGLGPENYAHATFDGPAEFSIFDWGQGSAAAGFAEVRNRFGDVWVDAGRGTAYGVDNVHVESFRLGSGELAIELGSPSADHVVTLKVDNMAAEKVRLVVNGEPGRTATAAELRTGVRVPTRQQVRIVHNPTRVEWPPVGESLVVSACATHDEQLAGVALHHRASDGPWRETVMTRSGSGSWEASVPVHDMPAGQSVHYYIVAKTDRQSATAPEVDPMDVPFVLNPRPTMPM